MTDKNAWEWRGLPGSTYLMERVHFAVAYVNKGNIYLCERSHRAGFAGNGGQVMTRKRARKILMSIGMSRNREMFGGPEGEL